MDIKQLQQVLEANGFARKELDTGIEYHVESKHIRLVCYIEPGINVAFTSFYKWKNNDVKGMYILSMQELHAKGHSVADLFKSTLSDMPECIGLEVDAHTEVAHTIDQVFA